MEYAAAKNTLCRQCGRHFIVAAAERVELAKPVLEVGGVLAAPSLLQRVQGILHRPRITSVTCFDCGAVQQLNSAASSTICPSCSVHMDLRDYKVNTAFSRAIRTHGRIHVTSAGDLSSSSIVCRSAIIDGKLRGSLQCNEKVEFRAPAKVQGKLSAGEVIIGKKADVQFFRQIHVGSIEIRGRISGEIAAETMVTIRRTGSLEGNVVARSINVERGGTFSGQLMIGQKNWGQAELIPEAEERSKAKSAGESRRESPEPYGMPARPSAAA
jgi:cytoskeletal protein CcmA (bactofilin family)